jgi:hypothetical protein
MAEYICPHCQNPITDDEALLCHFCGESLGRPGQGFLGRMKYAPAKNVTMIVVGFVVLVFFLIVVLGR